MWEAAGRGVSDTVPGRRAAVRGPASHGCRCGQVAASPAGGDTVLPPEGRLGEGRVTASEGSSGTFPTRCHGDSSENTRFIVRRLKKHKYFED